MENASKYVDSGSSLKRKKWTKAKKNLNIKENIGKFDFF